MNAETARVVGLLGILALCLNGAIDSGKHEGVTIEDVYAKINDGTILPFLEALHPNIMNWGLINYKESDKRMLLGEWQSLANVTLPEELLVSNNGIHLILGYVIEGIKWRTNPGTQAWPGPEPL